MTQAADPSAPTLRVMSFNIRFGSAKDGENAWEHRRDFVIDTIKKFDPDLLGTQETEAFQRDALKAALPEYDSFAAGRNDGKDDGEMMAVFYRKDRFKRIDGGHFWLSETPEVPGSKSWDSSLPRMVTWLKLEDQQARSQSPIWFFNTHFDHRGPQARIESAKLIHNRLAEIGGSAPVILTGDFNSPEGSKPYQELFAAREGKPFLLDTWRRAHPEKQDEEGTFNRFDPTLRDTARIDWIACTAAFEVNSIEINHVSRDGRVPSDHYPIEAVLRYAQ